MRGPKISLEGIDGAGKTTQIPTVENYLRHKGYGVYRKPSRNDIVSTGLDNDIVKILKGSHDVLADVPAVEVLLNAGRSLFMHERYVKPQLAAGRAVLCDRDVDTAFVYGMPSMRRRYPEMTTPQLTHWMLGAYAIESTIPDLTLWFDVSTDVALGRAMSDELPGERAVFTNGEKAFLQEVQGYYSDLHTMFPGRIQRIDVAQKSPDEVGEELTTRIGQFLEGRS